MEQTGWYHTEAIGRPLTEIFSLIDERSQEPIDILALPGDTAHFANKKALVGLMRPRGKKNIPVEANITFIQDGKGNIYGRVLVFRDVTHQRQILQEVERRANQAEALVNVAARLDAHLELDTVLNTICEITNRTIKASGTAVFLHGGQKNIFQNVAAISYDPALRAYRGSRFDIPSEFLENFLSRDKPVIVIDNIQDHADLRFFVSYQKMDIRTRHRIVISRK